VKPGRASDNLTIFTLSYDEHASTNLKRRASGPR